ncbi:hypothetical protein [Alkalihalobacillus pseudalcaliphilus]|uniref:hypothetical protein n=1 Tax=Alkalihalobacillus pseudalcaliphilus TaxID=79884 RepID=UPI00064DF6EB|nr:hypothetical protein [Alkalihalobacillus pseudalcaliphilus]KMK75450.1 hypothetical protein AB990_09065 [Alkalihalobacillus pseudalcaliphilus]
MKKRMLLPINLQYFAEPNEEPTEQNVNEQPEETPEGESPTKKQKVPYDRFKEKIDEVNDLKRQLKEFEEAKQAEETKDLADKQQWKELYDKSQEQLAEIKQSAFNAKKEAMLAKAGYTDEQIAKYGKYLEGETDEELRASLAELKADIAPKQGGVDPILNGNSRQESTILEPETKAKSYYQQLKASGRLRK